MLLLPLPSKALGSSCTDCDKPQANWALQPVAGIAPICSLCVLYKVPWLGKNAEDIAQYVAEVERASGQTFQKTPDGRILRCEDADRLVASLVLTGKVVAMARRKQ